MKSKLNIITFILLVNFNYSFAQLEPGIVKDWQTYISYQDSVIHVPIVQDSSEHILTAGFVVDSVTGADIMVAQYKLGGGLNWKRTYSGSGYNRDLATALAIDDSNNVYVAGTIFNSTTNYDYIILKYDSTGTLLWTYTYNGTANNYDVPSALLVNNNTVFVTGASMNTGTQLDIATIAVNRFSGSQLWVQTYDHAGLYDLSFDMKFLEALKLRVTGGSQNSLTDWDYLSLDYDIGGTPIDSIRVSGTSSSFDRIKAGVNDGAGNFYFTGASADSAEGFNMKTVKINTGDTIEWIKTYNYADEDDEGNGIIADTFGNVYTCGKSSNGSNFDYVLIKYKANGDTAWTKRINNGGENICNALCFDGFGNIVVTGESYMVKDKNFLTIAFDTSGAEIWHDVFDGNFHGNDYATNIIADAGGNVYVTGQSQISDTSFAQVTIKYRTDYFIFPEDTTAPASSLLFYPNTGQIIDNEGNLRSDVWDYTINQFPKIYFHNDSVSFVLSHIDGDTSTTDTLERISMNFEGGSILDKALESEIHDTDQILNYFLGHCPEGITNVKGAERLTYTGVYNKIDVVFSNNTSGMKFQIIIKPDGDPNEAQLHFTGHQLISIVDNSDLKIDGLLGSFTYERPLVYQIDEEGNRISLGWLASYNIIDDDIVSFILGGDYDPEKALVIECAKQNSQTSIGCTYNLCWSTYYGGDGNEESAEDIVTDDDGFFYVTGYTNSTNFPYTFGGLYSSHFANDDVFIIKFTPNGSGLNNIVWATYYGGSLGSEHGEGIAVTSGSDPDVYVTGWTSSFDFPVTPTAYQQYLNGSSTFTQFQDAFIIRLDNTGQNNIWTTFFGGDLTELSHDIVVNSVGDVYVCGSTNTNNAFATNLFPIHTSTASADPYNENYYSGGGSTDLGDGFIARFSSSNVFEWGSYYGGDQEDELVSMAVMNDDEIVAVGGTRSSNSGYTIGGGNYVAQHNGNLPLCGPTGCFDNSQLYGGGDRDILVTYFTSGDQLFYSTYLGGNGTENLSWHSRVASIGAQRGFTLVGGTSSTNFPMNNNNTQFHQNSNVGNYDAIIVRIKNVSLDYSTYFGGGGYDVAFGITIDVSNPSAPGNYFISGQTSSTVAETNYCQATTSTKFPFCYNYPNSYRHGFGGGESDAFIASFNNTDQLVWSSYVGGGGTTCSTGDCDDEAGISIANYQYPGHATPSVYMVGYSMAPHTDTYPLVEDPNCYFQGPVNVWIHSIKDAVISRFDGSALVGISETEKSNLNLSLFPNPSSGEFTLEFFLEEPAFFNLTVINSFGQIVLNDSNKKKAIGKIQQQINLDNCADGIYLVQLNIEGRIITTRMVIQK
jgi:hypothetical protein